MPKILARKKQMPVRLPQLHTRYQFYPTNYQISILLDISSEDISSAYPLPLLDTSARFEPTKHLLSQPYACVV